MWIHVWSVCDNNVVLRALTCYSAKCNRTTKCHVSIFEIKWNCETPFRTETAFLLFCRDVVSVLNVSVSRRSRDVFWNVSSRSWRLNILVSSRSPEFGKIERLGLEGSTSRSHLGLEDITSWSRTLVSVLWLNVLWTSLLFCILSIQCLQCNYWCILNGPGFGLVYHVLGLGFEAQILGLGLCVLDSNTDVQCSQHSI